VATPQMHNPADVSGGIQAAIKNLASNNVFYFNIPVSLEVVFAAGAAMEVGALAAAWKGIEESLEVSTLVNGECFFLYVISGMRVYNIERQMSILCFDVVLSLSFCILLFFFFPRQTCPRWTWR